MKIWEGGEGMEEERVAWRWLRGGVTVWCFVSLSTKLSEALVKTGVPQGSGFMGRLWFFEGDLHVETSLQVRGRIPGFRLLTRLGDWTIWSPSTIPDLIFWDKWQDCWGINFLETTVKWTLTPDPCSLLPLRCQEWVQRDGEAPQKPEGGCWECTAAKGHARLPHGNVPQQSWAPQIKL
jgi:hypothetical protein